MKSRLAFASLVLLSTHSFSLTASPNATSLEKEECDSTLRPSNVSASYRGGRGIGYNRSYSTVSFFLTPKISTFIPFADIRGHVFNDGKYAANTGIGGRWILPSSCIAVGGNIFYDYRQTHHKGAYSQIGAGVETIGPWWDAHINGYLPVGRKKSNPYRKEASFAFFKGHNFFINLDGRVEFVMNGVEAAAGVFAVNNKYFRLHFSAGPYYFWRDSKHAAGAQTTITAMCTDYFSFGVRASYDTFFHGRTPWFLTLTVPFGPKKPKKGCANNLCKTPQALNPLLFQGVDRFEIMVAGTRHVKICPCPILAIDPKTGRPYVFDFVNNASTGSDSGTFENPFQSFASTEAGSSPGDILYVEYGDGTANNYDGITLQNNQQLLGSGQKYCFATCQGTVVVPALTPCQTPTISNISPGPSTFAKPAGSRSAVILAQNNVVSGFNVIDINPRGGGNALIRGDTICNVNATITNNTISLISNDVAIEIEPGCAIGTVNICNNTIISTDNSPDNNGIGVGGSGQANIIGNTLESIAGGFFSPAIDVRLSGSTGDLSANVLNNSINGVGAGGVAINLDNDGSSSFFSGHVNGNTMALSDPTAVGIMGTQEFTNTTCLSVHNNTATGTGVTSTQAYQFTNASSGPFQLDFGSDNTPSGPPTESGITPAGSCP